MPSCPILCQFFANTVVYFAAFRIVGKHRAKSKFIEKFIKAHARGTDYYQDLKIF